MKILHSQIMGSGQPLLILHGFLGMSDNWKTLGKKFAEHQDLEVHLIDQRNHGRSFHDVLFNYELLANDLLNYMNSHGLDKVFLLGHSMGGKTAMHFAVANPERVKKLIVADIGPKFYPEHHEDILAALNAVDFKKISSRQEVEQVLEQTIPEIGVRQFLLKNVFRLDNKHLNFRFNLASLTDNYDEIGVALPLLTQYYGEVLFLKGQHSGYISEHDEPLIKAHFPKHEIVTVKNAGHWLHAENPNDFYDEVVRFLSK